MIDASQVARFADRLQRKAAEIEAESEVWQSRWGSETADGIRTRAPRATGRLASSIRQVRPGEIELEEYWKFLEGGTAHMPPQPFIRPAVLDVTPRAVSDARRIATDI